MLSKILLQWRLGVLAILLIGPILAYMAFGTIWLWERGWLWLAVILWIVAGLVFAVLSVRWTRNKNPIMPPLDWDSPRTFSPRDREAWKIVEQESEAGETIPIDTLIGPDLYIETGRRLLNRLATFYHPNASDPLDQVPLVELLTAIELAADDLGHLSRQVPGGDLIALSHWRRAVQMAGYISKANDWYSMVSPILNPLSGLARLGTRELVIKPAWRDMQQNILRWFYQAYVNRLGVHMIELMSGRLAIGAAQYRRLTRRANLGKRPIEPETTSLTVMVAGSRGSGKSRLIDSMKQSVAGDVSLIRARFEGQGLDPSIIDNLARVQWVEVPGYSPIVENEGRRDRSARASAVNTTVDADLVILVVDGTRGLQPGDVAFTNEWDRYFITHTHREPPPTLVVLTGVDRPDFGTVWAPPYDWNTGKGVREAAVRSLFESLRATLPPTFQTFTAAGLPSETAFGVVEHVIPALAGQLHRAERTAMIRQLQWLSGRSKAGRVFSQIGQHGREIWSNLKLRRKSSSRPTSE